MTSGPSSIILHVERAAEELRRGRSVLVQSDAGDFALTADEAKEISDLPKSAIQLLKIAGLLPRANVQKASTEKDMLQVSEAEIAAYPQALVASLEKISEAKVPLEGAKDARIFAFRPRFGHDEHLAIIIGNPASREAPLVRVHSSCLTGDILGSLRCDCGSQLKLSLETIAKEGAGVIIYLNQEGRGIGIASKLRAYALQDNGMDTVDANTSLGYAADERDFALAAEMLKQLGIKRITLLTNNPRKPEDLEKNGIAIAKQLPLATKPTEHNQHYLETKQRKLGHRIKLH